MTRGYGQTAAIILAAGASTRLGQPKQLFTFEGAPLLEHTVRVIASEVPGPVFVVIGHAEDQVREALNSRQLPEHRLIFCPDWQQGMGASLAHGVRCLTDEFPELQSILISVCDQPYINRELIQQLLDCYDSGSYEAVLSCYDQVQGPPACFSSSYFPLLRQLTGDRGAKSVLNFKSEKITSIPFPLGAIEVDTPADAEYLLNH